MTVYAAGAVLWREQAGKLYVAMVHRARYNDWAWAKGKVDPGETLPETAVREVREETGLKVKLGIKLPVLHYKLPSGEAKEVHYWAAKVTDKALANSKFKPDEEVAEVLWVEASEARAKLTYPDDELYLDLVIKHHKSKTLNTKPFIVLRHGKATPREEWSKDEATRPLLKAGEQQAKTLVPLLNAFGPKAVVTSPWKRCVTTVEPYAKKLGVKVVKRHQISELGNHDGPRRTMKVVHNLIGADKATVLCSHRPALPHILQTVADYASSDLKKTIHEASTLKPGHMLVVHLTTNPKRHRQVVSVETYSPFEK